MSTKTIQVFTSFSRLNIFRYNTSYCRYYSRTNTEQAKQSLAITTPAPDYLIQNLKNAKTSQNVLETVGAHCKIMNTKQLMQALRSIFILQKQGSSMSTQQIINNHNFEKLCRHLKTQAGLIELNETIEALKVVSYIGVSSKSTIVQVLLQLLRHNINDLSLQHIIFLDFLLKQFEKSPLVDALLIALPIVFDVNLPVKLDKKNVTSLVDYLQYVSRKNVSEKCITLIVNSLYSHLQNNPTIEPKLAKSIVWSICDMEENEFFEPLFKEALNAMLMNIDLIERRDLETTLSKLSLKYSSRFSFYYDEVFFDTCANDVVDKDLGFEEALYTLRKLSRVNHSNVSLLNYLSKVCYENPNILKQASAMTLFNIVISIAQTEFKPIHWKTIEDVLLRTNCFKEYNKSDILWMKLNKALCSLDIYKFDILEKCFDSSYLDSVIKQKNIFDYEHFVLIYQAITAFQPDYLYLLPPKSVLESVVSQLKPTEEYPLEVPLQNGLGGEKYVKTCVKTTVGHHIDHVIVLRKGGYPVALSDDIEYLEDIEVPSDSNMILVLALGPSHYTINNKQLKGGSALILRTLECRGHTVIPIALEIWESLAEFEKVPYLMQAIKSKTENEKVSNIV